jgi:hypothetical protein
MATTIELLDQIDAASAELRAVVATEESALDSTQTNLALTQAQLAVVQQNLSDTQAALTTAQAQIADLKAQIVTVVPAGGDLQAALNKAGKIQLTAGAVYTGHYVIKSGTTLLGNGASIKNPTVGYAALDIPPGTTDVDISDLSATTVDDQRVILVGRNDTNQVTLEQRPQRVKFTRVKIPTFRGKHAFELSGKNVTLLDCEVVDAWDPAGRDSQAISITANGSENVLISGGTFSAGSEVIMVGGDTVKIPGFVASNITIENLKLWRPLSWQTDGVNRAVKNLLELKTGINVTIRNIVGDGCWRSAQDGWAFMITPKSGGTVDNVLIEDVTIDNVGGLINITGVDFTTTPNPPRLTSFVMRRVKAKASLALYGGRGAMLLVTQKPINLTFDDITFIGDGTTITTNGTIQSFTLTNSLIDLSKYAMFTQGDGQSGYPYANNLPLAFGTWNISGNTFAEATSAVKTNLPGNTYVDKTTYDALSAQKYAV